MNTLLCALTLLPSFTPSTFPTIQPDQLIHFTPITQKGLVAKLTDKANLTFSGQKVELLNDAKQTITEVAENGDITVQEDDSNLSVMVNGSPMPAPQTQSSTATMDKLGRLVQFKSASGDGSSSGSSQARMFNLTILIYPGHDLKTGEKWTAEVPANTKLGTKPITANYTVDGIESIGKFKAIKVEFSLKEGGDGTASSSGTMWIDVKDGMTDKITAKVSGVPLEGAPGNVDGTLESNRID